MFSSIPASVCTAPSRHQHVCFLHFHSDSCGLHLLSLHKWCPSIISPPNIVGLMRSVTFVLKCAVRTSSTTPGAAALPLERKSVPRRTVTHPWFSETKVAGTSPTDSFKCSSSHFPNTCLSLVFRTMPSCSSSQHLMNNVAPLHWFSLLRDTR